MSNPKAIAFWLAIASIGAVDGAGIGAKVLFVLGAFCISYGCHAAWALTFSIGSIRQGYARSRRWIEAGLGSFFALAAIRLGTSQY